MRRNSQWDAGFTLLEVSVALVVGGLVLLGVRIIVERLADAAMIMRHAAIEADRAAVGERLLRVLVGRTEVGTMRAHPFSGTERVARFGSWCDEPGGWEERCTVTLAIDSTSRGRRGVTITLSTGESFTIRRATGDLRLLYLSSPADGGVWLRTWPVGVLAPHAIGLAEDRDTAILRIGPRG